MILPPFHCASAGGHIHRHKHTTLLPTRPDLPCSLTHILSCVMAHTCRHIPCWSYRNPHSHGLCGSHTDTPIHTHVHPGTQGPDMCSHTHPYTPAPQAQVQTSACIHPHHTYAHKHCTLFNDAQEIRVIIFIFFFKEPLKCQ